MRFALCTVLVLVLAGSLPVAIAGSDETSASASSNYRRVEEILVSPKTPEGAKSRLIRDPQARSGYSLAAELGDKPGGGFGDGNMWYGYTYLQRAGKIRATFRIKIPDNTVTNPVVRIRGTIDNSDLLPSQRVSRVINGTEFALANAYQEFSIELSKGEQGFCDWAISILPGASLVSFDGLSVTQVSTFDATELLEILKPPSKPTKLSVGKGPFLVHETHGLFMELWGVRRAISLLPKRLDGAGQWTQSYLNFDSQQTTLIGYPSKWEDLYRNQIVVLNNVPAKAVTVTGVYMLTEFVNDGGCLVMIGDTHGFAAGNWDTSLLSPLLPVTLSSPKFIRAARELVLTPRIDMLRKLDLNWSSRPYSLYYHPAEVKRIGRVLVGAGNVPLVVEGPAGKGRVIVFLNAVLGEKTPREVGVPFWLWKDWPALVAAILTTCRAS